MKWSMKKWGTSYIRNDLKKRAEAWDGELDVLQSGPCTTTNEMHDMEQISSLDEFQSPHLLLEDSEQVIFKYTF